VPPVIVTSTVVSPGVSDPGFAVIVRETGVDALAVPFAGVTLSHAPPEAVAVNERLPAAGIGNLQLSALRTRSAKRRQSERGCAHSQHGLGSGLHDDSYGDDCAGGLPLGTEIVTEPCWGPAESWLGSTEICKESGITPAAGVTTSQDALEEAA